MPGWMADPGKSGSCMCRHPANACEQPLWGHSVWLPRCGPGILKQFALHLGCFVLSGMLWLHMWYAGRAVALRMDEQCPAPEATGRDGQHAGATRGPCYVHSDADAD